MKSKRLLVLVFLTGLCSNHLCQAQPEVMDAPPWESVGYYTHPPIQESSGLAISQRFEGVYWTLNDSGNPPALYATRLDGELIREFSVQGAENRDWEALEIDDKGQLWIGEIGNNSRLRDDLTIYVAPEPNPFKDNETQAIAQYPFEYPDENVDAEGMFVVNGAPYIVSKESDRAVLYRFTTLRPGEIHTLEHVGQLVDATLVTGADMSTDGTRLAVCTYDALWVYHGEANDLPQMIRRKPWTLKHDFGGETVAFDGYDLVLTNERREIYRLPLWWYEQELPLPPRDAISALSLISATQAENGEVKTESYRDAGIDIGGEHVTLTAQAPGAKMSQALEMTYADIYEISVMLIHGPEYAQAALMVNGRKVGESYDCYRDRKTTGAVTQFGATTLQAGKNDISLQIVGKSTDAQNYKLGVDSYLIRSASAFAPRCLVLGPFPRADRANIDAPLPPEKQLDPAAIYQGVDGQPIRWKEAEANADGRLDLLEHIGEIQQAVGYALAYVHSKTDREAALFVGSDDEIAVWVNGAEVHRNNVGRGAYPDQDVASCQLKAGWNTVLCKVGQQVGGWALYLRISDPDGALQYATRPH